MENVTRLGVLTDEQKRDFFAGIDAFCLPSRTDSFGLVLLEAWANGKPVVAYRAGGPADLIRDGTDGFLVKCGDVTELAGHLTQLAANPGRTRKMGERGRERVAAAFRWDDKLRQVRDTLSAVVHRV
jgi:glycosyltransferase involved in cell wall biosynthesis